MPSPTELPWSERLVAHRGYAARFPENTLAAITGAFEAGARRVEVDVQLSADRVPFLMHDRTLERMCGVPGTLAERSASELARLRAAESGRFGARFAREPLASLDELVAAVAERSGAHAYVELKRASLEVFGRDAVLDAVVPRLEPLAGRCTLISFDVAVLRRARERFACRVGPVLIAWGQLASGELDDLRPDVLFCDDEKLPEGALLAPCELAVYEVDRPQRALELAARGVTFVETFQIGELLRGLA